MNCVPKSISPCIETLLCVEGMVSHLPWHQARFDQTRKELYNDTSALLLSSHVPLPPQGRYRLRVEYTHKILNVEALPYVTRTIERLEIVPSNVAYAYKYAQRHALDTLIQSGMDDVIITCKGELRDTTIANIALLVDGQWLTPKTPLLEGTTRARLLCSGFLKTAILTTQSLQKMEKFAIMNALLGFKILENPQIKGL